MSITSETTAKTLSQLVATQIKVQLVLADMRQSELARRIGKNEQWLSVRLRGTQPIDMNDLALIADALGVSVAELVRRAEGGNTPNVRLSQLSRTADRMIGRTSRHTTNGVSPMAPQRRDRTRPVSAIPATRRRPTPVKPPARPIPA